MKLCTVIAVCVIAGAGLDSAIADQVIADDLIVKQSLGVGFDVADGESFGFEPSELCCVYFKQASLTRRRSHCGEVLAFLDACY